MITPRHVRTARAAFGWSIKDLAEKADIGPNTILRFEHGDSDVKVSTLTKIEGAFHAVGVVFHGCGIEWPDE